MRFGSDYDQLPDVNGITEELRKSGKLTSDMILTNAGETKREDATVDPLGSLRLEFENAEIATDGLISGNNGTAIGGFNTGAYLGFTDVEMDGIKSVTINYAVPKAYEGATLELRLDSPEGPIVGTATAVATDASKWHVYKPLTMKVSPSTGIHDIYITSPGERDGVGNFDWIRLETGTDKSPVKHNRLIVAEGVEAIGVRTVGDLRVVSNGYLLKPEEPIYKKGDTVMTPLADTLKNLGYSWNEETLTITDKEGKSLTFAEGKDIAYVDGVAGRLLAAPERHENGSWWVPIDTFKLLGDYVDYVESSGYVRIMDVTEKLRKEHLEKINGETRNLAYRKPVAANSVIANEVAFAPVNYAVDGSASTYWQAGDGDKSSWIWVNLTKSYPITKVAVNFGKYAPESFNVYISNDSDKPENWTRVATIKEFTGSSAKIEFPKVYAKYVKIGDLKRSDMKGVYLNELEVYEK